MQRRWTGDEIVGRHGYTRLARSVREGVQHHVDSESLAIGRELLEAGLLLGFSLERISDVRVMGHEHLNVPYGIRHDPQPCR